MSPRCGLTGNPNLFPACNSGYDTVPHFDLNHTSDSKLSPTLNFDSENRVTPLVPDVVPALVPMVAGNPQPALAGVESLPRLNYKLQA
ncbi:hypothetical protein EVAR_19196_1 [Eumeta japonica]|uniref:Uncharacterized protein n=1 Tax=Eumeta variegata TaxID=151549 RepID=A0A4C1VFJ9_EUMVA|nr:hypothetical protein EVAR_19196_1 [Eumeta japonica]